MISPAAESRRSTVPPAPLAAHVLIVDSDPDVTAQVAFTLARRSLQVRTVEDADEALRALDLDLPDLVILELDLPGLTGMHLLERIRTREDTSELPVIVLTGRRGTEDLIEALSLQADDYLTKPFHPEELVLRVAGVLRRVQATPPITRGGRLIEAGSIRLDTRFATVTAAGREVALTASEYKLLAFLMEQRGKRVSRTRLHEVMDVRGRNGTRTVDMHVRRLREKLRGCAGAIETVRGFGYRFRDS